jgi:predicted naringenin-chalcone synthase
MWNDELKHEDDAHRLNHALCNSLFSDGCFAVALVRPTSQEAPPCYATLHEFASHTCTDAMHTMTYNWSDLASQFWFYLSEEAPYAVGSALKQFLHDQIDQGMPMEDVLHYVVHTGGQTVIDSVAAALGLDDAELMATRSALRKFGNNSSASYMFAFAEFLELAPRPVAEGDLGVFITMGPGAGFELCLWSAGSRASTDKEQSRDRAIITRIEDPPWDAGFIGNTMSRDKCRKSIAEPKTPSSLTFFSQS